MSRLEELLGGQEETFFDWNNKRVRAYAIDDQTLNAIKQYAKECCAASLDKAFENSMLNYEEGMYYEGWVELDKDSIINKENILLL